MLVRVLAMGLIAAVLVPTLVYRTGRGDLGIALDAASHLWRGKPVYDLSQANEHTKPPLATLLFVPLSFLPRWWLERMWDVAVVAAHIGLAVFFVTRLGPWTDPGFAVLLGLLFTLNPWNAELRQGQTNVLLFAVLVLASLREHFLLSGVCTVVAVLLKPTNIFFVPWVWRWSANRKRLCVGMGLGTLALCAVHGLIFGKDRFLGDQREWLRFLPLSTSKHLLRADNYGLPTQLAALGWENSGGVLAGALALSIGLAVGVRDKWLSLAWLSYLVLMASPMAWIQNFTLLLLPVLLLWRTVCERSHGWSLAATALGLLYFGFEFLNPTVLETPWGSILRLYRLPFFCLIAAMVLTLGAGTGQRLRRVFR